MTEVAVVGKVIVIAVTKTLGDNGSNRKGTSYTILIVSATQPHSTLLNDGCRSVNRRREHKRLPLQF